MTETRRDFIKTALQAGIGASVLRTQLGASVRDPDRGRMPNILLLLPDQWRGDWMSTNPALPIRTPNLDRIASRGIRFDRAFVASPLCAPSRGCLASGMEYEHADTPSNSANYPERLPTFYGKLRDSGYHVLGCGKMDLAKNANWWGIDGKWRIHSWGFSDGINNAGKIDQVIGLELNDGKPADPYMAYLQSRGLMPEHVKDYNMRRKKGYAATAPTPLPDDAYCDNWVTENGLKLLDQAPSNKPWFMQVNWPGPHNPEDITASMERSVRSRKMPPVNGSNQYSAEVNGTIRQNYTAMCENIDRGVGKFLDWLEASGQLENTLVIFSSDHGEMLGDHGRWGKTVPFQASVGVPMLIAGPAIQKNATSSALVSSIDLTATCLDYGGAQTAGIDGKTLRPVLEGKAQSHRQVVYSGLGPWRMVCDGQYKVITGFGEGRENPNEDYSKYSPKALSQPPMVFDMQKDPMETKDLADSIPAAAQTLLNKLKDGNYPA
jgi:arylsulfatase